MEATSTIQETIDIHQAAEEAIFDPLPDVMNENFAVVIEDRQLHHLLWKQALVISSLIL
jgi:hypothetical protein